ncbi:N-acetylmuramoyl-L-alanine amidase [Nocardioides caeni]|uniref:Peptidoglycan recognition protein family domain-containing protein n=1 Tax=Nocardioides caeni TaxID=574700 RepID=A0A4S8NLK1_9ACTN|nr:N-acetylmuramoyl-L-alanine amidase [Nocardioides caeni]THV17870.1 hypothetical protein E9934_05260 [Nocardioides caeni]
MSSYLPEHPDTAAVSGPGHHDRPGRLRFVTVCQHLLALAVVVAVLTPAARTVTMDVQPAQPVQVQPTDVALRAADFPSKVPTGPVAADVDEYALTAPAGKGQARASTRATAKVAAGGEEQVLSDVVPVDGYGAVGVTWAHDEVVGHDAIGVQVRTRTDGAWSGWEDAEYHDEHGPDPASAEGKNARPGTDALLVGDVDAVQVKVATEDAAPADMKLAVIDPGTSATTTVQAPAIDTAKLGATDGTAPSGDDTTDGGTDGGTEGTDSGDDSLELQAGVFTPKPKIYSRAQWGANERLRDKGSLTYYEVHGGFVHHTVNANDYTASEVPGILRAIYAYHVNTRGWSDIGYNFLVDRFGRIWEGRAGGVDRAVVGAHTLGYNNYAFAMSAIGNFDTARPSARMVSAYGALFAWKLSLHGVDAGSTRQRIGSKVFQAINGHRDAGSTACPGRYLYAKLPQIRELASAAQRGWSGREVAGQYVSTGTPDLLTRRTSDGTLFVFAVNQRADGTWAVTAKKNTGIDISWASRILRAGDWDRDGNNDVLAVRRSDKALLLLRGQGRGRFAAPVLLSNRFSTVALLSAPGDVTGDGFPDLMGQRSGRMYIFPGKGGAGLGTSTHNVAPGYPAYGAVSGSAVVPAGLVDTNGAPDALVRNGRTIVRYLGNGPGGWTSGKTLEVSAAGYDWLIGAGRINNNRYSDYFARTSSTKEVFILSGAGGGWQKTRFSLGRFPQVDLGA